MITMGQFDASSALGVLEVNIVPQATIPLWWEHGPSLST